ncbi:MAG: tetratricopeptide repeat protein, partial [Flavobacterium sp.]|nr:tetratricopeptide repeat protein [Flavobacterium sp.]
MNEEKYLVFENYLNNDLDFEEKETFENELKSNSEIASAFEIYKDLTIHLQQKFETEKQLNAYKENLKIASGTNNKKFGKIFSLRPIYLAIAACFALVFGLMIFNNSKSDPTFTDYYQKENANFTE